MEATTTKKIGTSIGVILGLVLCLISATMYSIDLNLFTNSWLGILNFIVIIGFGIFATIKSKKNLQGQIDFKESFIAFIIPIIIGVAIYIIFNIVLFNVINPEAKIVITENAIKMTEAMLSKFNVPKEKIIEAIEKIENTDNFGPFEQLKSYFFYIAFYSVVGLIVALIFKTPKNKN